MKTGICANCGADNDLHQYETNRCPMNGREETTGYIQKWGDTLFEDSGDAIAINEYDKLKAKIKEMEECANDTARFIQKMMSANSELQADVANAIRLLKHACDTIEGEYPEDQWNTRDVRAFIARNEAEGGKTK